MTKITLNGNEYSDDTTGSRDLTNGGHRTWLLPMLSDAMAGVGGVAASAAAAEASAVKAVALAGSGISGTSTSSLTIGTGTKAFTTQAGKAFVVGHTVQITDALNVARTMTGTVTAYDAGTGAITVEVSAVTGSGSGTSWSVRGYVAMVTNAIAPTIKAAAYTLLPADRQALIMCNGTFTLGLTAAATLGAGWYCYAANVSTGDVTLDPAGSELIDGVTGYIMYSGEVRLITCTGTAFSTVILNGFTKTYTASGTFTKPPGYLRVEGLLWGGGGSGATGYQANNSTWTSGGGGGGCCTPFNLDAAALAASVAFTIAAGGVASATLGTPGVQGGQSTFASVSAYGGGGGGISYAVNGFPSCGGGGGGPLSAGVTGSLPTASPTGASGGGPGGGVFLGLNSNPVDGSFGGGAGISNIAAGRSFYGGGAGGSMQSPTGGASVYGGAGGGGHVNGGGAGSTYGGAGGSASSTSGNAGSAPAGGGGAGGTLGGNGARGELRIWGIV